MSPHARDGGPVRATGRNGTERHLALRVPLCGPLRLPWPRRRRGGGLEPSRHLEVRLAHLGLVDEPDDPALRVGDGHLAQQVLHHHLRRRAEVVVRADHGRGLHRVDGEGHREQLGLARQDAQRLGVHHPEHPAVRVEDREGVLPARVGDAWEHRRRGRGGLEADEGAVLDHDVAHGDGPEHVEADRRVRGRVVLGGHLRVVERALAERDEGDALGEHQRDEQVVAAGELADHDERAHRHVGGAAVEDAHPDERERAGIDARIVDEERGGVPERAAEEAAEHERGGEVAGAAAACRW